MGLISSTLQSKQPLNRPACYSRDPTSSVFLDKGRAPVPLQNTRISFDRWGGNSAPLSTKTNSMGARAVLAWLLPDDESDVVVECRQCRTNLSPDTDECPECGSVDIGRYRISE